MVTMVDDDVFVDTMLTSGISKLLAQNDTSHSCRQENSMTGRLRTGKWEQIKIQSFIFLSKIFLSKSATQDRHSIAGPPGGMISILSGSARRVRKTSLIFSGSATSSR